MPPLAVLSDVHGNLPALRAVLADLAVVAPNAPVWCAGDFVGYGPWPDECVQILAARSAKAVSGNYDEKTLAFPRKREKWRTSKDPRKFRAFEHAWENLSDASRDYLAGLPIEARETFNGHKVLMTHIAPDDHKKYGLHPLTSPARFESIAHSARADVIVTGHTHWPMAKVINGVLFVNAGSAGRPGDGDGRAAYALLHLDENAPPRAEIRRVAYPVEEVVAALGPACLPAEFAGLYRTGRGVL